MYRDPEDRRQETDVAHGFCRAPGAAFLPGTTRRPPEKPGMKAVPGAGHSRCRLCLLSPVSCLLSSDKGFGLVAAVFVIVFMGLFGLLAARHLQSTSIDASETWLWAQALYTANSTARLRILTHDGGGGSFTAPVIQNVQGSITSDNFAGKGAPSSLEARGATGKIVRTIRVKYIL